MATARENNAHAPGSHLAQPYLYDRTFDEMVVTEGKAVREVMQFFAEVNNPNATYYKVGEMLGIADVPQRNEDTDRIPIVQPREGFNQTIYTYQFRLGVMLTERAVRTDRYNVLVKLIGGLPKVQRYLEELAGVSVFDGAFDTITTADGDYLCDTTHEYADKRFGTYSNMAASGGTIAPETVVAGWQNLMGRQNEDLMPDPKSPTALYYHYTDGEDVAKVKESMKYPGDALNAAWSNRFKAWTEIPSVMKTNTTSWFMFGSTAEADKGLLWVWEQRPNYAPIEDGMNPDMKWGKRLKVSFGVGAVHGKNIYGNAGA